jgi:hypothetical protein
MKLTISMMVGGLVTFGALAVTKIETIGAVKTASTSIINDVNDVDFTSKALQVSAISS